VSKIGQERKIAQNNWDRYTTALNRGHDTWQNTARENENFYLGGGRQWTDEEKSNLEQIGKPWLEENIIFSAINTVLGYQTQSRMDIALKPRGDEDTKQAEILSKISMFTLDQNEYPWVESQAFSDGIIQGRGYLDIRMEFDNNVFGEISLSSPDPMSVIPDPDANSYDPDDWEDVIITDWMSYNDMEVTYGATKARKARRNAQAGGEPDFGIAESGEERNKFGELGKFAPYWEDDIGNDHFRIIDRQWFKLTNRKFWVDLTTGDFEAVPDGMDDKEAIKFAKEDGLEFLSRIVKRVRWTVTTKDCLLHDDWSPYDHFTIIPFFPYFRRGKTVGMVDNLVSTQRMINKAYSQILHVINTTANSGWKVEEGSLSNMDVEDLEDIGAQTGLVIEFKAGRTAPEKIEPNPIPQGLKDIVMSGVELSRLISGVSETFQGGKGPEVTGAAIQSRVHQSAVQLAGPIDNLFRTRHMLANRLVKLIQTFYTEPRVYRIASPEGEDEMIEVNQPEIGGSISNDLTVGKYDVVIADVPTQVTFRNSQFQEAIELRKYGVGIPDVEMVKLSGLSRKNEIAESMSQQSPEQQQIQQQQLQLQLAQIEAEIAKLKAESTDKEMSATKSAAEVAEMIMNNPGMAPAVDELLMGAKQSQQPQQQQQPQLGQQMPMEQMEMDFGPEEEAVNEEEVVEEREPLFD